MKSKLLLIFLTTLFIYGLNSCSENDPEPTPIAPTTNNNDTTNTDTTQNRTKTQMLAKRWIVDEAYVDVNTPDASSKGLILDVRADGSYTLVSTGYIGTWEFEDNERKINWDKGTQFNQVFKYTNNPK